jgi:DNA-nicking Smr family endonuclease
VNEKDIDEFRRAMQGTTPLQTDPRVPEARPKPKPAAKFTKADEKRVLAESLEDDIDTIEHGYGAALRFHRPHVGRRTMRKLQRGAYSVQDEIDLHGMTLEEAKPALSDFINYCASQGKLCIRIVHGKGLGSGDRGPVLKNAVNRWLDAAGGRRDRGRLRVTAATAGLSY